MDENLDFDKEFTRLVSRDFAMQVEARIKNTPQQIEFEFFKDVPVVRKHLHRKKRYGDLH